MNKKSNGISVNDKKAEAYNLLRAIHVLSMQSQQLAAKLKEVESEIAELETKAKADGS